MVLVALALLCFLWVWRTTVYARRAQAHLDAARTHARDVFTLHPGTTVLWDAEAAARGEKPASRLAVAQRPGSQVPILA